MKKIRIVNIISRMIYGGVESVIYNYYSNMDLERFDLYIITRKDSKQDAVEKFKQLGFKIIFVDDWEKKPVFVGKQLLRIFKNNKFDIIHSHLSHTNFYFMLLAKISKIPIRISHSHLSVDDRGLLTKLKHSVYKVLIKFFSTNLMACGNEAAENLYGKNNKNVLILYNAIDLTKFEYNESVRNEYRNELGLKKDDFCLFTIGRMTYQKNQLFLIDIFKELIDINRHFKLLIIGNGELKDKLINKIKLSNLEKRIIILSDRNDVNNLLCAADIFCLPSLYEGLPVVGIEAQASGLPCVFSDTIDLDVKRTKNCYFISLEKSAREWAGIINNISLVNRNLKGNDSSFDEFDINLQSRILEKFYISEYEKRCINEKNSVY